ncbi:MAG: hypothetical protein GYA16_12515 [Spirochaetes bacterium]|nr:hypothetical protein [Spirochaetota bacterium]HOJ29703.1 hypothetical protein [Spirochaetota bacterium]HOM10868.1 hypothetical protein [Spirochaetota bacterium]HPP50275.1 hypothetical protein [Spirochaetota bacterium]
MPLRKMKEAAKDIKIPKRKPTSKSTPSKTVHNEQLHDAIRLQAYYNYLHRITHNTPGDQLSDWLEAEKYILNSRKRRKPSA